MEVRPVQRIGWSWPVGAGTVVAAKLGMIAHMGVQAALSQASDSFWYSPGFGGIGAVIAAAIVGGSALVVAWWRNAAGRAQLKVEEGKREDVERAGEIQRCWDRFVWVVAYAEKHAVDNPALIADLCDRVFTSAVELNDLALKDMVNLYLVNGNASLLPPQG